MAKKQNRYVFKRDWSVGNAAAENDQKFLENCFIDTGYIEQLSNLDNNKSIVLGRVGIGKSAILAEIEASQHHIINIDPEQFSISYISNSTVLKYFDNLGVKLDPFFQALWKHVLCVELIKKKYKINTKEDSNSFYQTLRGWFIDNEVRKQALEYFSKWGGVDFWETTEIRVRELTRKIETDLGGVLGGGAASVEAKVSGSERLTEEEKTTIRERAQKIVDGVQMHALHEVISTIGREAFNSKYDNYYILIDDLDLEWADNQVRYRLIRALIDTVQRFRKIRNLKIIISLRSDLLETVVNETRGAGFQEEKYEDYFIRVNWSVEELRNLVDIRISELIKEKYTQNEANFYDIFPERVFKKKPTFDYMIERTLKRPRDIILFVNKCFDVAAGRPNMTQRLIVQAEADYSSSRLNSIMEEWIEIHPDINIHVEMLKAMRARFTVNDIPVDELLEQIMRYGDFEKSKDPVTRTAHNVFTIAKVDRVEDALEFLGVYFHVLHKVGICGIKTGRSGRPSWSEGGVGSIPPKAINLESKIYIHPMVWMALGIGGVEWGGADSPISP